MNNSKFSGMGPALVTPFRKDGSIDFKSLGKLVEYQIENNADYLVVLGSTGEAATISKDEKIAIVNHVCDVNAKRVPIVVGFGGNNTNEVVQQIKYFERFDAIDAILSVAPCYNKPSQQGLFLHFQTIASVSPVPIIIYNVPGRTGVNIEAETTLKIASEIPKVIATKEASGDMEQIMSILKDKPKNFQVISGDDLLALPLILLGADGVISVIGNAFPKNWSLMVKHALNGNNEEALKIHYQFMEIIQNIFVEGNPAGIKATLNMKDLVPNHLRLPLTSVSRSHYSKLSKLIDNL